MNDEDLWPMYFILSDTAGFRMSIPTSKKKFIFEADSKMDLYSKISGHGFKKKNHYLEQELKECSTEEIFELLEFLTFSNSKENSEALEIYEAFLLIKKVNKALLPIKNDREAILTHLREQLMEGIDE